MTNEDDQDPSDEIVHLQKWALRAIATVAGLLGVLFAWVQLRQIPLPSIENYDPTYIRRIVLAFYYTCWVFGTTVDANIQKDVYRRDPDHGKIPREASLAIIALFIVAAILLWASDTDERISLALAPFLIVNIVTWRILVRRVTPIIASTADAYQREGYYQKFEQLEIVRRYLCGSWQWVRFAVMALIVIAANLLCFSPPIRLAASQTLQRFMPEVPPEAIAKLLPVTALFLFVLFAETWAWILRARNAIALDTIVALAKKYRLKPRN